MPRTGRGVLLAGGAGSALIALLHAVVPFLGPRAYGWFGAAELMPLAEAGSPIPALLSWALAAMFAGWALVALSGAGVVRRMPFLVPALLGIGAAYTLRGLLLVPALALIARGVAQAPRMALFSAAALVLGLLHLEGARRLRRTRTPPAG